MSNVRKPIAGALILNKSICVVEVLAGLSASSLNLIMDPVHKMKHTERIIERILFVLALQTSASSIGSTIILNVMAVSKNNNPQGDDAEQKV